MKALMGCIKKEIMHILRDPRTLLILFALPIIQLLLFGYAVRNEVTLVELGIVDQQEQRYTNSLAQRLEATGYFRIHRLGNHREASVQEAFQSGGVSAVLVVKNDIRRDLVRYGKAEIQLLLDASNPNLANIIEQYVRINLKHQQIETVRLQPPDHPSIQTTTRFMFNPELKSSWLFVPGLIAVILMLVSTLMTSITIAREKEMGSIELLLVSPLHPFQIILGKVVPYFLLSFVNIATILVLAIYVFEVPFVGSILFFLIASTLFILLALSLGILISSSSSTQLTAMLISMVGLLLPTIILSGFIFPIKNLPDILQYISMLIPATWYLEIVRGIMLKGMDWTMLGTELSVLVGMTLVLLILSVKSFKVRLT